MAERYTIQYQAENSYEFPIREAVWQFLIIPQENQSQRLLDLGFENSADALWEVSENGYGFPVIRLRCRKPVHKIHFRARFEVDKKKLNPFDFNPDQVRALPGNGRALLDFRVDHNRFLQNTRLSRLPAGVRLFVFDEDQNLFDNLMALNTWVYETIHYREGVTHVDTCLEEVLVLREGVCQDFAHLFLGLARKHGVPARYVSGYLHQGHGYFGDTHMHAWVEAWLPGVGWVGFDPTNNLLAASDHIKVAHGRDYQDCAPLKGVLFGEGANTTDHKVQVQSQQ